jgi:RNA polymerase-binding transcription factor DksA
MTPEELEHYKQKLLNKKAEILSRLEKYVSNNLPEREEGQDDIADKAEASYTKSVGTIFNSFLN